ncbi:hypothetical protein [Deinococcus yavapaiensis]|uniref:Uncharacterized protein n=1 Tax=Deinococcus yavapaiensis KR-236 TaxID=694435 RepID=A0A318S7P0_9DEIO|nr:hypothetical protein [Deinococcus yavapaiensis]PYE54867.1 hypothetical protein DES52_104138 [Deinococcus yavapaiensis KR-236]
MTDDAPEFLSTHDLKGRGWTASLIRDFLGNHDATRPNMMRFGRRRKLPPVKLYATDRVDEAERDERFLIAQGRAMEAKERAERAKLTRRRKIERAIDDFVWNWQPSIVPGTVRKGASRKAYDAHVDELKNAVAKGAANIPGLTNKDVQELTRSLDEKYRDALKLAYPWMK